MSNAADTHTRPHPLARKPFHFRMMPGDRMTIHAGRQVITFVRCKKNQFKVLLPPGTVARPPIAGGGQDR